MEETKVTQLELNISFNVHQKEEKEVKPESPSTEPTENIPVAANTAKPKPQISNRPFWSEVNGLILPFFILDKHSDCLSIEYRGRSIEEGETRELIWKVAGHPEYGGLPGIFEWQLHRALEEYISTLPRPIRNPIPFSIYDLCKRMGLADDGRNYLRVKEAIKKIKFTGIVSEAAFYSKNKRQRITDIFSLYDRVIFRSEEMPDGAIAETNYLWLNSWYLDNINHHYVRPLDSEYYWSLQKPLARRLYELLGPKFFGLPNSETPWRVDYFNLCQMLPIKPQRYLSDAKQILDPAHKELVKTGYLADVQWKVEGKEPYHWHLEYYKGERAIAEIQRAKERKYLPKLSKKLSEKLSKTEPKIHKRSEGVPTKESKASKEYEPPRPEGLAKELTDRGVILKTANRLVAAYPESKIKMVVEYVDWYQAQPKQREVENLAAYIIRLIEDPEFAPSEDFYKHQELQKRKKEEEALKQKARQIQRKRVAKALSNWNDAVEEEIIEKDIERYKAIKRAINKCELTIEEIKAKRSVLSSHGYLVGKVSDP